MTRLAIARYMHKSKKLAILVFHGYLETSDLLRSARSKLAASGDDIADLRRGDKIDLRVQGNHVVLDVMACDAEGKIAQGEIAAAHRDADSV